ncbi:hypothetical protein MCETRH20_01371 [Methylophilaceae bacterium]
MVSGQLLVMVTQPMDQLELALSENRIEALRLTASALAVCSPFWMDSAAVRTRIFYPRGVAWHGDGAHQTNNGDGDNELYQAKT